MPTRRLPDGSVVWEPKKDWTPAELSARRPYISPNTETPEERAAGMREATEDQLRFENPRAGNPEIRRMIEEVLARDDKSAKDREKRVRANERLRKLEKGFPLSDARITENPPSTTSGTTLSRNLQLAQEGRSPVGDVVPSPLLGAGGGRAFGQGPMVRTAWPPGAQAPTMVFRGPISPSQTGLMNLNPGQAMPARSGKGGM